MADYERAFDATAAIVEEALKDAAAFVDKARACLRARGMVDEA